MLSYLSKKPTKTPEREHKSKINKLLLFNMNLKKEQKRNTSDTMYVLP